MSQTKAYYDQLMAIIRSLESLPSNQDDKEAMARLDLLKTQLIITRANDKV